jgi:DNA-binding NarL/FixJ family response regulator
MSSTSAEPTQPESVVRIALVDDHPLMLAGMERMIQRMHGYKVVLKAKNGREFIDALPTAGRIDVAVLDLFMPLLDGFETIEWLDQHYPEMRVLALSFSNDPANVQKAMMAGAHGYLVKDMEPAEIKKALDQVMRTGYYHTDLVHASMLMNPETINRPDLLKKPDEVKDAEKKNEGA